MYFITNLTFHVGGKAALDRDSALTGVITRLITVLTGLVSVLPQGPWDRGGAVVLSEYALSGAACNAQ